MRHFPFRELGYAFGFVVVLAALYVGAYYAAVERSLRYCPRKDASKRHFPCSYRVGGDAMASFFEPMERVDRRLRPGYWRGDD
jgi:hypothetical protein